MVSTTLLNKKHLFYPSNSCLNNGRWWVDVYQFEYSGSSLHHRQFTPIGRMAGDFRVCCTDLGLFLIFRHSMPYWIVLHPHLLLILFNATIRGLSSFIGVVGENKSCCLYPCFAITLHHPLLYDYPTHIMFTNLREVLSIRCLLTRVSPPTSWIIKHPHLLPAGPGVFWFSDI